MALSRSAKITIFLVVDIFFFFIELIVGYVIGSLALVADSFHMLNDVMSLLIALYAIKLTSGQNTNSRLSYGWSRAEILAAFINGVFLLALCFSIALEAIQRFTSIREISNPRLIVVVGSIGFLSNIVGLLLFHEHGHGHSHDKPTDHTSVELKRNSEIVTQEAIATERSITPSTDPATNQLSTGEALGDAHRDNESRHSHDHGVVHSQSLSSRASLHEKDQSSTDLPQTDLSIPLSLEKTYQPSGKRGLREADPYIPPIRPLSYSSLYGYPAATRAMLIHTAHDIALQARSSIPSIHERYRHDGNDLKASDSSDTADVVVIDAPGHESSVESTIHSVSHSGRRNHGHHGHHSHHGNHGSMNMRALILHVMGDALGNIGVIVAGLVIWFGKGKFRYYFDPMVSLMITAIIFSSALPLVRSAAFVLLQGVPSSIVVEDVERAILAIDGVLSLHELHVWQLSETKIVASVHVTTSRTHDFMMVALNIRKSLHDLGIHSSTIQPEYDHPVDTLPVEASGMRSSSTCLILCPSDQKCDPWQHSCCRSTYDDGLKAIYLWKMAPGNLFAP